MAGDFRFDEESHTYWLGDQRLPGVTTILSVLGGYEGIPAKVLKIAAERGTAVHKLTELEDLGQLDYTSIPDEQMGYLEAYWRFHDDFRPEVLDVEVADYHETLLYAGCRDRRMVIKGRPGILDVKTCYRLMPTTGPQTAGYTEIYNARQKKAADKLKKRWGLRLGRDGTYELKEYNDPSDLNIFLSCLNAYRYIQLHNPKKLQLIEELSNELEY